MEMVEIEFRCVKCDRIIIESYPENTDFSKLDTTYEHDFDCSKLDAFDAGYDEF